MKVAIYYTQDEGKTALTVAAFTRKACHGKDLHLIRHEIHHESTEFATAS